MVELFARIGFGNVLEATSNIVPSNISNVSSGIETVINHNSNGGNPFMLGISRFNEKKQFSAETLDYYISADVCNSEGYFNEEHTLTLTVSSEGFAILTFDLINKEYPYEIKVDDTTYYLDSPILLLPFSVGSLTKEIKIIRWNKPNKPIVIQGISTYFDIQSSMIRQCNLSNQDRTNAEYPSWGIISNTGNLQIVDTYNVISKIRDAQRLYNCAIEFFIKTSYTQRRIGKYYITDFQEGNIQDITLFFGDILQSWQKIQVNPIVPFGYSAYTIAVAIKEHLGEILDIDYIIDLCYDYETEKHLGKIKTPIFYYEKGSLWNVMQKICEATACYISCDTNGVPKMKFDRWL